MYSMCECYDKLRCSTALRTSKRHTSVVFDLFHIFGRVVFKEVFAFVCFVCGVLRNGAIVSKTACKHFEKTATLQNGINNAK